MSRVAITGCAGRFARVLLPLLEADTSIEKIIGIDQVPPRDSYSKLEFHASDIRSAAINDLFAGCDSVVHLAFIVGRPYSMPLEEAASINLAGTWNICSAATQAGVRKLIVSSSIASYGSLPDNPDLLLEDNPLRGLYTRFYYSQHKHANEIWLDGLQYAFPDLLISRLRPCIVIGPNQLGTSGMIQPNKTHFTSPGAQKGRLQLVHEDDLAAAFHVFIQHNLPGAYNVVGDGAHPMPHIAAEAGLNVIEVPGEVIQQAIMTAWKNGDTIFGPEWSSGELSIICSNEKLKATGLWHPRYTTIEALASTVAAIK
jgi:UDP-glucose 4-epimerase